MSAHNYLTYIGILAFAVGMSVSQVIVARDPSCSANVGEPCMPQFDPEYVMSGELNGKLCCATGFQCALDQSSPIQAFHSTKCVARTVQPTVATTPIPKSTTAVPQTPAYTDGITPRAPTCSANVGQACDPQFDPEYIMYDQLNPALCCSVGLQCAYEDTDADKWNTVCVVRTDRPTEASTSIPQSTTPNAPQTTAYPDQVTPRSPTCSANLGAACDPQFNPESVITDPLNPALCCSVGLYCSLDMINWATICVVRTAPPTEPTTSIPQTTTVVDQTSTSSGQIMPRSPMCNANVQQACDPQFDPEYIMTDPFDADLCCAAGLQCAYEDVYADKWNTVCVARTVPPSYTEATNAPLGSTTVLPTKPHTSIKTTKPAKTTKTTTKKTTTKKATTKKNTTKKTTRLPVVG